MPWPSATTPFVSPPVPELDELVLVLEELDELEPDALDELEELDELELDALDEPELDALDEPELDALDEPELDALDEPELELELDELELELDELELELELELDEPVVIMHMPGALVVELHVSPVGQPLPFMPRQPAWHMPVVVLQITPLTVSPQSLSAVQAPRMVMTLGPSRGEIPVPEMS